MNWTFIHLSPSMDVRYETEGSETMSNFLWTRRGFEYYDRIFTLTIL